MIWDRFELISNFEATGIAIIRKVFIKKKFVHLQVLE